jgi:hypothetical protein
MLPPDVDRGVTILLVNEGKRTLEQIAGSLK